MLRFFLLITVFLSLIGVSAADAWDVVAVQSCRARPYAEALQGFRSACDARVRELVISELSGEDIVAEIRKRQPDLILAIGMDALLKVRKIKEKPIVYMMVLQPDSVLHGERNITGVGMIIPPEKQVSLMRKVLPHVKKVGLVYSPKNTRFPIDRVYRAAARAGIELTALKANRPEDFPGLLRSIRGDVDAYWMLPDGAAITPEIAEDLILFSMRNRIPVFTFSDKYLKMGALMSVGVDTYKLGKQAGDAARKILSGTDVSRLREVEAADAVITINYRVAEKMQISVNETVAGKK